VRRYALGDLDGLACAAMAVRHVSVLPPPVPDSGEYAGDNQFTGGKPDCRRLDIQSPQ
jgi:hypothetical protein